MVDQRGAGMISFNVSGTPLTADGLHSACGKLSTNAPELWAVIFTETDPPYGGFFMDARPQILFERRVFHNHTGGRYDATDPDVSGLNGYPYGAGGAHQYDRLSEALKLDSTAALQSASWGIGQTLGENFKEAGYASAFDLVTAMFVSEDNQIVAAANEMINTGCAKALAAHDWTTFARIYNGPGYAKNNYDTKLASWYAKCTNGALPDLQVRTAQYCLNYLGFGPVSVDGLLGNQTLKAITNYQQKVSLPITDELDGATFDKLSAQATAANQAKPAYSA
jgi:hypothetical protein